MSIPLSSSIISAVGGDPTSRALTDTVFGDGVKSPSSNLSYAAGTAGVLTGAYGYNVTFVTAKGETPPWSGTPVQVTLASQNMNLTNIPVGPAETLKRRIYRSKANSGEAKNTYLLTEIADNTTTTYTDNTPDASLSSPVSWIASNYGNVTTADGVSVSFGNSGSVVVGALAKAGYASVAIGGQALGSNVNGFRNVAVGIYALTALTSGAENIGLGTHAGQGVTTGTGNTVLGTYAMMTPGAGGLQNYNVVLGHSALGGFRAVGYGSLNVMIGYRSGYYGNTADNVIAIGPYAGQWFTASCEVYIDNRDRGSVTANYQDVGLIYAKTAAGSTPAAAGQQDLRLNAPTRIGWASPVVANLPTASAALKGYRAYVTDASVAYTGANIGTTVASGGSNTVPVFCIGTAWVIG